MSKKSSFSRTDGDVCCCSMVGVSISPSNTRAENGLFRGEWGWIRVNGVSNNFGSWTDQK